MVDGADLCVECGLCCTGALFDHGPLGEEERALAAEIGLAVEEPPGAGLLFRFPCPALDGTRCGVYPRRPAVCGEYACALLERYQRGEVTREAALARVAEVRAIVAAHDPAALDAIRRGARHAADPAAYARDHAEALAAGERLRMLLRADFWAIG